jgi:membrane associated rhomboid family serine protease
MATCDQCGKDENMPYNCRHCGGTYCSEHRLPENHACPGLGQWDDPDGVFDSGFDDSVQNPAGSSRSSGLADRVGLGGPGSLLERFRDNVSFLFLVIIVGVFVLQFLVVPLVGPAAYSRGWLDVFTLTTTNPQYVWTWVISVFAHGSPTHLLFNAIVLYFFGPVVERQIGSRKFAALFLVSGTVAGLAQVGLGLVLGETVRVLGASGALLALMGVLALTSPELKVLLFFVIPMSVRTLTVLFAAFSVFAVATQAGGGGIFSGVAHFAHLIGLVFGVLYGYRIKDRVGRGPQQVSVGPPGRGGGGGRFP